MLPTRTSSLRSTPTPFGTLLPKSARIPFLPSSSRSKRLTRLSCRTLFASESSRSAPASSRRRIRKIRRRRRRTSTSIGRTSTGTNPDRVHPSLIGRGVAPTLGSATPADVHRAHMIAVLAPLRVHGHDTMTIAAAMTTARVVVSVVATVLRIATTRAGTPQRSGRGLGQTSQTTMDTTLAAGAGALSDRGTTMTAGKGGEARVAARDEPTLLLLSVRVRVLLRLPKHPPGLLRRRMIGQRASLRCHRTPRPSHTNAENISRSC